jgi:hypothetical protein
MKRACVGLFLMIAAAGWSAPVGVVKSKAAVTVHPDQVVCALRDTLFGINVSTGDKPNLPRPEFIDRVKKMGITSCRFPNGCQADIYNWKSPGANQVTADEFLDFCDAIGAEPYYTINMQGGTEGLAGPAPKDAPLDEVIKYQHLAPNPCGNTNYHFGTLAETLELVRKYTVDRALAGKRPILHYEMGNENWGQAFTDWPPDVYARTIEVYAKAMRAAVGDSKLKLHITAVGFPVMGNNMKMVDSPDRATNVKWTAALNKLHEEGLIDAVQEHFYPQASANGGALAWAAHNLRNIILARRGEPNPRLDGYRDPSLAYLMPMEHTEWNVKCWGPRWAEGVQPANGGFEDGLDSWAVTGKGAVASDRAARRGARGLEIAVPPGGEPCEVTQVFNRPQKARTFVAAVWVRTGSPGSVKVQLRQANDGDHKGEVLGEWSPKLTSMWERVVASAKMLDETKQVALVLRVDPPVILSGAKNLYAASDTHRAARNEVTDEVATVCFDEARLYYTTEERGQCPISATTFEQALFCVDAFREMALQGCPRAHLHHLAGNYPCGAMTASGEVKDLGRVFEFFAGARPPSGEGSAGAAYGDRVLKTDCECKTFGYYSAGNPWATDFNALAPDRPDIPMLGCLASRRGNMLHLLLVNRTSDRDVEVAIDLGAEPEGTGSVRTLAGEDIDLPGVTLTEGTIDVARRFNHVIAPYTAQIISADLRGDR